MCILSDTDEYARIALGDHEDGEHDDEDDDEDDDEGENNDDSDDDDVTRRSALVEDALMRIAELAEDREAR